MKFGVTLLYEHECMFTTTFSVNLTFISRDRSPYLDIDDLPDVITPLLGNLQMSC